MKTRASNLVKFFKKLRTKKEMVSASVSFDGVRIAGVDQPNLTMDFFEELNEAVRSGDESIWRMWR